MTNPESYIDSIDWDDPTPELRPMPDKPKLRTPSEHIADIHVALCSGRHDLAEKLVRNRDLAVVERQRESLRKQRDHFREHAAAASNAKLDALIQVEKLEAALEQGRQERDRLRGQLEQVGRDFAAEVEAANARYCRVSDRLEQAVEVANTICWESNGKGSYLCAICGGIEPEHNEDCFVGDCLNPTTESEDPR